MKTLTTLVLALTLAAPVSLSAAAFEGTVRMNMTPANGKTMPMTFSIKPGFTRVDMEAEGHTMGTILDQAKQEAIILMPQQKMYMVHSLANAQRQAAEKQNDATLEKTNQHESILGYDTTKYVVNTKDGSSEIWATEQLGTFLGMGSGGMGGPGGRRGGGGGMSQQWENVLRGKEVFPLRAVTFDKNHKEVARMEATDVKKQSLPDSLFTPPADYQKFDMGGMMRGMMPGLPGRGQKND